MDLNTDWEATSSNIKIYGPSVSPFVTKVVAAASYKKIPFERQQYVSISQLKTLNPHTGKVPVAAFGKYTVFDSSLILRRFDIEQPSPPLVSEDKLIAAKQYLLEDWSDEALYWYMMALRWCDRNEHLTIAQNREFVPAPVRMFAKPILRRLVGKQARAQGLGRLPYQTLVSEFELKLDNLAALLREQPFFHSERPSVADFAIYGISITGFSGPTPEFPHAFSTRPELIEWRSRMDEVTIA